MVLLTNAYRIFIPSNQTKPRTPLPHTYWILDMPRIANPYRYCVQTWMMNHVTVKLTLFIGLEERISIVKMILWQFCLTFKRHWYKNSWVYESFNVSCWFEINKSNYNSSRSQSRNTSCTQHSHEADENVRLSEGGGSIWVWG